MDVEYIIGGGEALRRHGPRLLAKALNAGYLIGCEQKPFVGPALLPFGRAHFNKAAALLDNLQTVCMMRRADHRRTRIDLLTDLQCRRPRVCFAERRRPITLRFASDGEKRQTQKSRKKTTH